MAERIKIGDFPTLATIIGNEKLPLGRASDGNGVQITMQKFKDWIGFTQFSGVVPQKAPSFTITGGAGSPAIYIGNKGTYILNGVSTPAIDEINFLFWNGSVWSVEGVKVKVENKINHWTGETLSGGQRVYNGKIYEAVSDTTDTDKPGNSSKWIEVLGERTDSADLFEFQDVNGAVVAAVNSKGEFDIAFTEATKERAQIKDDSQNLVSFKDASGHVVAGIDSEGFLIAKIKEDESVNHFKKVSITGLSTIKKRVQLVSTAVGQASSEGVDDAIKVNLVDSGYTHPKVLFIPNGFGGFKYWMAITPTFGPIGEQVAPAYFENPHIFCSNDGLNWAEPIGISNPIDVTAPLSYLAPYPFWSDTHLLYSDDGWLYCYYRGVGMPKAYLNPELTGVYDVVLVCKKSKDGINWSDRMIVSDVQDSQGSPAWLQYGSKTHLYDLNYPSISKPFPPSNMPSSELFRRSSVYPNGEFGEIKVEDICIFKNNAMPTGFEMWHVDVEYAEGVWFALINSGRAGDSIGQHLYLAYSFDGWTFEMFKPPIYFYNSYRSSLTFIGEKDGVLEFNIYRSDTLEGSLDVMKMYINIKIN